jgi:hypothetical protein
MSQTGGGEVFCPARTLRRELSEEGTRNIDPKILTKESL